MRKILSPNPDGLAFKKEVKIHRENVGREEKNSHPAEAITISTNTLTDKEIVNPQKLAEKFDSQKIISTEHESNSNNPHQTTAQQVGADPEGTAASAIETHESNNAHPTVNDSPEFANIKIPALNTTDVTGGEITPTLLAWIQSVYAGIVAKSVKSHIIGIWSYLETFKNIVYTVEGQIASQIDFNVNFKEGELFYIYMSTPSGWGTGNQNGLLRVNDIYTSVYANGASSLQGGFFLNGANLFSKINVKCMLLGGNVQFDSFYQRATSGPAYSGSINVGTTVGQNIISISKISILAGTGSFPIGTKIIIAKK